MSLLTLLKSRAPPAKGCKVTSKKTDKKSKEIETEKSMSPMEEIFEGYEPFDKDIAKSRKPKGSVAEDNHKSPKHAGKAASGHLSAQRVAGGNNAHKKNKTEAHKSFPVIDADLFKAVVYVGESEMYGLK